MTSGLWGSGNELQPTRSILWRGLVLGVESCGEIFLAGNFLRLGEGELLLLPSDCRKGGFPVFLPSWGPLGADSEMLKGNRTLIQYTDAKLIREYIQYELSHSYHIGLLTSIFSSNDRFWFRASDWKTQLKTTSTKQLHSPIQDKIQVIQQTTNTVLYKTLHLFICVMRWQSLTNQDLPTKTMRLNIKRRKQTRKRQTSIQSRRCYIWHWRTSYLQVLAVSPEPVRECWKIWHKFQI